MSDRDLHAPWRLVVHAPADGAWNMAVDESLLAGYVRGRAGPAPTLRLYGWEPAALSLGKGQPADRSLDRSYLRRAGIDLVRRPTGGRAVLHDQERTYAVIGHLGLPPFPRGVVETYRRIAAALELGLQRLGAEAVALAGEATTRRGGGTGAACFSTTSVHEITVAGRKLVGSAQLRRRCAFLQHGSIPLRADTAALAGALGGEVDGEASVDLERVLGRQPEPGELDDALLGGFAEAFGCDLRREALSAEETLRAERLRCWKYDSASWTLWGRTGVRERRWAPAGIISDWSPD